MKNTKECCYKMDNKEITDCPDNPYFSYYDCPHLYYNGDDEKQSLPFCDIGDCICDIWSNLNG